MITVAKGTSGNSFIDDTHAIDNVTNAEMELQNFEQQFRSAICISNIIGNNAIV